MKLKINQNELADKLSIACLAVSNKPTHPILSNLLLSANIDEQQLMITAFDQSLGIRVFVNCSIAESGQVALPAKLLEDVIFHLDKSEISLEVENFTATITHSSGRCRIQGIDSEEFPALPEVPKTTLTISTSELLSALKATGFAASKDSTKLVLAGVHFKFTNSTWEAAATDGHRLAIVSGTIQLENADTTLESVEATVPYQTFIQLEKILTNLSSKCSISIGNGSAVFELPDIQVISQLLEGQYPNYSSLIPTKFKHEFTIDKKSYDIALKRVSLIAEQKHKVAKVAFDLVTKNVIVSTESSQLGNAVEALPFEAESNEHENLQMAFNIKYLLDAIKVIASDKVLIRANTPEQVVLINPVGNMSNQLIMIMPVQVVH